MSKTKWRIFVEDALYFIATIATFAFIGVLLAWRG